MKYLDRFDLYFNRFLMVMGGIAICAVMLLATGNVAMRVFHVPFSGSYEIISFLGAIVTASALGYTQRHRDHIVVDILSGKFPSGVKRFVDLTSYFLIAAFFTVVSHQTFLWGMKIRETGELSETLKVIYHPFVFGVALGFAFLALAAVVDLLKASLKKEDQEEKLSYE